jgi:hypothetical protein
MKNSIDTMDALIAKDEAPTNAALAARWDEYTAQMIDEGHVHILSYGSRSVRVGCSRKDGPMLWAQDIAPLLGVSRWDLGDGLLVSLETLIMSDGPKAGRARIVPLGA